MIVVCVPVRVGVFCVRCGRDEPEQLYLAANARILPRPRDSTRAQTCRGSSRRPAWYVGIGFRGLGAAWRRDRAMSRIAAHRCLPQHHPEGVARPSVAVGRGLRMALTSWRAGTWRRAVTEAPPRGWLRPLGRCPALPDTWPRPPSDERLAAVRYTMSDGGALVGFPGCF